MQGQNNDDTHPRSAGQYGESDRQGFSSQPTATRQKPARHQRARGKQNSTASELTFKLLIVMDYAISYTAYIVNHNVYTRC